MPEPHKRNPNTVCAVCGKPVYRRPCELTRTEGRAYCSNTCYGISCQRGKPCVVCGALVLASLHRKTCSRACANKHRAGIKYTGAARRDKVKDQRALKSRLIEQRGTSCERCSYGIVEVLQVHHKDRSRQNNELDNLELICPNCHCEEHYLMKSWLPKNKK